MGGAWDVLQDARHFELVSRPYIRDDLADGILLPEILVGCLLRKDNREWLSEGCLGVSSDELKAKDLENSRIGKEEAFFGETPVSVSEHRMLAGLVEETHGAEDAWKRLTERWPGRPGHHRVGVFNSLAAHLLYNAIYLIGLLMVPVVAQFILDVEYNQEAAGNADGEAQDVDEGVRLVPEEIPASDFQVVSDHDAV